MKLPTSIRRELTLLSRSIYFYVEIATTVIFLAVLLFLLPEHLDTRVTEYYWFNADAADAAAMESGYFGNTDELVRDDPTLKVDGVEKTVRRYTSDQKYAVVVDSREDLIALAEQTGDAGVAINHPSRSDKAFTYYLQGYETDRYKSYAALIAGGDLMAVADAAEHQPVRALEQNPVVLNDRQSALPLMLTLNCVLMGILVAAAYIVEDKKTNTIKALRVVPASIMDYLLAKVGAVLLTSLVSCLILAIPVMGGMPNYPLLLLTVLCGGFFTAAVGALIASFYSDMGKAFAAVYLVLMVLLVPAIAGLLPGWDPWWLRLIPSYFALQSMQDALTNRHALSVLLTCGGYLAAGALVLLLAKRRYKAAGIGR